MTRASEKQLWRAAVHQAGHAVVFRVLHASCGLATLVPDWEQATADLFYHFDSLRDIGPSRLSERDCYDQTLLDEKIIVAMAGAEAEREIIGSCGSDALATWECDCMRSNAADSNVSPRRAADLRGVARQLVKKHRNRIFDIADQLIALYEMDELLAR